MTLASIEKNNVDISKLFTYKKKITLLPPGLEEPQDLYLRVIGDEVQGQAKVYALRKSATFRENLRNPKWEDRSAYLPKLAKIKKDDIISIIISLSAQDLSLRAINNTQLTPPAELSGESSLEEQEAYQAEVDSYEDRFSSEVAKAFDKIVASTRKDLVKVAKDVLVSKYEEALINQLVSNDFTKHFEDFAVYRGVYRDAEYTKLAFSSIEDFVNAPTQLRQTLLEEYNSLDIRSQELKKLRGVTH